MHNCIALAEMPEHQHAQLHQLTEADLTAAAAAAAAAAAVTAPHLLHGSSVTCASCITVHLSKLLDSAYHDGIEIMTSHHISGHIHHHNALAYITSYMTLSVTHQYHFHISLRISHCISHCISPLATSDMKSHSVVYVHCCSWHLWLRCTSMMPSAQHTEHMPQQRA